MFLFYFSFAVIRGQKMEKGQHSLPNLINLEKITEDLLSQSNQQFLDHRKSQKGSSFDPCKPQFFIKAIQDHKRINCDSHLNEQHMPILAKCCLSNPFLSWMNISIQ